MIMIIMIFKRIRWNDELIFTLEADQRINKIKDEMKELINILMI